MIDEQRGKQKDKWMLFFCKGVEAAVSAVSTIEVEAVLSNVLNQQDTIVYGVEVPGVEGRAGMAAIVEPSEGLDLKSFLSAIKNQLPSYATPIFLRFVQNLDITGEHNIMGFFFVK